MRSLFVAGSALLITLGLSSCGSSNSVPWVIPSTTFAYLQDTSSGTPEVAKIRHQTALAHSRASLKTHAHIAGKRAATAPSVDIQTGSRDLHIYDTSNATDTKVATGYAFENVQLSNDGTKLVFTGYDSAGYIQIYLADAKFQALTQLTTDETEHNNATISADGTKIAYDNDDGVLYTIPVTGGTPTAISTPNVYAIYPAFTPDGSKLVFTGSPDDGNATIYIVGINSTGLANLSTGIEWDGFPTVSPDGTKIVFERDTETNGSYYANIAVIGIGGETTANPATILTTNNQSWQPMSLGTKILYLSWYNNPNDNIYEMNADGSNVTRLTNTPMETCFNWWAWD